MPQSLARILVHTVFSTKGRVPLLREPSVRGEMHSVLGGTAVANGDIAAWYQASLGMLA